MEHAAVDPTIYRLAIFALAVFVGYYVVWSVTPALHTPLMAVTNAISSVIIVGALLAAAASAGDGEGASAWISKGSGALAAALAAVNIFGGFLVTQRMLAMYRKKERPSASKPAKEAGVDAVMADKRG
jgi:NAD(P) transhydrogenase subunit alpha